MSSNFNFFSQVVKVGKKREEICDLIFKMVSLSLVSAGTDFRSEIEFLQLGQRRNFIYLRRISKVQ